MKLPFLIDTDTASDDAVALIMALRSPEIQVLTITTVAGNVDVHQASRNAIYTAELCDLKVPVFAGAEQPRSIPSNIYTKLCNRFIKMNKILQPCQCGVCK